MTAEDDLKGHEEVNIRASSAYISILNVAELTFPGVVGQDGARPHLLPLDGLTGAGLRAAGPGRPITEHAVS